MVDAVPLTGWFKSRETLQFDFWISIFQVEENYLRILYPMKELTPLCWFYMVFVFLLLDWLIPFSQVNTTA